MLRTRKNFKDEKNLEKNMKKKNRYENATQRVLEPALLNHVTQRLYPLIINREEGLEAGGVAKLCYCSMSRDNTSASKRDSVIRVYS